MHDRTEQYNKRYNPKQLLFQKSIIGKLFSYHQLPQESDIQILSE